MHNKESKTLLIILIITALIHLILIVLFMLTDLGSSINKYKNRLDQKKQKKEAKVIFEKPSSTDMPKKKLTPKLSAGTPSAASGVYPESIEGADMPSSDKDPADMPEKKLKPKIEQPKKELKKPEPKPDTKPKLPLSKRKKQKLIEKIETTKPKPADMPKKELKKHKPAPKPKPDKIPTNMPEKLTLADIAKGFMNFARKEGKVQRDQSNHLVTIIGGTQGQATAEQLKHERYIKKLFDCFDIAFKLHIRKFRFTHIPHTELLKIFVHIDINKTGQLASLRIVESSGNTQFDLLMEKVILDASRSFPPVPSSFDTEIYSIPIQCSIPTAILLPRRSAPVMV